MEYKDIYEELKHALWDENDGLLFRIHDPFHNSLGNLERSETLETIEIVRKFANKLSLDTKDEYALKTLDLICQFIGESYINADCTEFGGTEYDPEFMLDGLEFKDAKQPEPKTMYVVNTKSISLDDNSTHEENHEFFFYADAKQYMEDTVNRIREIFKDVPGAITKDEEREFVFGDNSYVAKIIEK